MTSQGRSFVFGPYIEENVRGQFRFYPLVSSEQPRLKAICLIDRNLSNGIRAPLVCAVHCVNGTAIDGLDRLPPWPLPQTPRSQLGALNCGRYFSEASLEDVKAFRTQNSTSDDEACTGVLLSTEKGHIVLGSWQCNLVASEWWEIGEGLSVRNFTNGNNFHVSVSPVDPPERIGCLQTAKPH